MQRYEQKIASYRRSFRIGGLCVLIGAALSQREGSPMRGGV